ncbi:Na(+)-translocating NADH-quinone reductase subunit C [Shewanella gelidii]|uniref:Na(+)-translocating NADH-quinone reductase subunit C n=1 Tax=Shewanella gelidii TaxID=1642821 RepID=A0A917JMA9_9GAMM|nr:Na(+)-translocating NADH-quinone reductase subunit C [Shewanella gelidii]MCL1099455.1 Na(+)-translocating NADH-quinone reductase subunit C [Shewanella gelidii]GGI77126.1 Na(+)-translocating NADH-quinone reductase subunit C [Shewanella gelidii]
MAFNKDSIMGTMIFTISLSLLCSFMITGTAEILKERKLAKKRDELKRYVLTAANVDLDGEQSFQELFDELVTPMLVDLDTGEMDSNDAVMDFDERMAAINPDTSRKPKKDTAKIKRRANQVRVFKVADKDGQLAHVVVPVHGKGLWSIIYGYVAVKADLNTIENVVFYEHGETPGIGDFVSAPDWVKQWHGKQVFDASGDVAFRIVKGGAEDGDIHGVDSVSGATKTARGIQRAVTFWFGREGYQTFFDKLKASEV